ncbi:Hpr(Ser) kinase/phosphatase [Tindallia magadiensis]|uniref:HPr kinase/phosphorylase n=1 Tax=Tindallia magadiensis TaxID=69895 RepID=A0A1I3F7Y3_9FIRM|nr:HPr(Ser) kinase/phosphatase [Tindallia magadiensis]SFI06911.1 Hpr(Ser) kinase/phosphatase [Tindallia magadiensis]
MSISVTQLIKDQQLEDLNPEIPSESFITTSELVRPGIQLAGYFDYFAYERMLILGKVEHYYLQTLPEDLRNSRFDKIMSYPIPCMLVSRNLGLPVELLKIASDHGRKILGSNLNTTKLISRLMNYLEFHLAETTQIHGVLMDVYGVGVAITGKSGIGKSETAIELIKKGHLLVADDTIEVKRIGHDYIVGSAPDLTKNMIEVRGIGILDVKSLYGVGAIKNRTGIDIVVHLEEWDQQKSYDRLGLDESYRKILDVAVEEVVIPVKPARNISLMVEVAARNHRQKMMGYHAAQAFSDRLTEFMKRESS